MVAVSKQNYKVLLSGLGGGISTGIRLAGWASVFVILDAACLETRLRLFAPQTRIDDDPDWHQTSAAASSRLLGHWSDGLVAGQGAALLASAACESPWWRKKREISSQSAAKSSSR